MLNILKMLWCWSCRKGHEMSDHETCPDCGQKMEVKPAVRLHVCPDCLRDGVEAFYEEGWECPICLRVLAQEIYPILS